jgi:hypothetical protein
MMMTTVEMALGMTHLMRTTLIKAVEVSKQCYW